MICEYCGGSLKIKSKSKLWISCICSNCGVGYAFRPTREHHIATLKTAYQDKYDIKMKEYEQRKKELIEDAKV